MPRRAKTSEVSPAATEKEKARIAKNRAISRSKQPSRQAVQVEAEKTADRAVKPHLIRPGQVLNPAGGKSAGRTLMSAVREVMQETSLQKDGTYKENFYLVAETFVNAMKAGSFVHTKEYIEREEGKVPQRIAGSDGSEIKVYVGMPTDGEGAP